MKTIFGSALIGGGMVLFKYETNWLEIVGVVLAIWGIIYISEERAEVEIEKHKD